ncbi:hypothetical protein BDV12DRAFT_177013 [Aspergillus spectabilis]
MALSDSGINISSQIPRPATYAITAFFSIALYNVLELTFLIFIVFKRRRGLYFWSFLVASWGIAVYVIGYILKDFELAESIPLFNATLIILGWCAMVTGQSLVLYSRLHLIVRRRVILRAVLAMIIINAIILHIPTAILGYGANSTLYRRFTIPYAIYERVQVTIFFLQELTISGLYMYEMCRLLYTGGTLSEMHGDAGRRFMLHLIYMNVLVIILDVAILVLQFTGRYASQTAAKGFIYSVKLKMEFNILNRLVDVVQRASHERESPYSSGDHQQGGPSADTNTRHHFWGCACPWHIFASRVKHAISDPAERR